MTSRACRNCPAVPVGERGVHNPPPWLVANRLLSHRPSGPGGVTFKNAGDQMSVVGASWIQISVHNWLCVNEQGRCWEGARMGLETLKSKIPGHQRGTPPAPPPPPPS